MFQAALSPSEAPHVDVSLYVVTAESVVRKDSWLADISSDRSMFHRWFRVIMQVDVSINFSQ